MILYAADLRQVHARLSEPDGGDVIRRGAEVYRAVGVRVRGERTERVYQHQQAAEPVRPSRRVRTLLSAALPEEVSP